MTFRKVTIYGSFANAHSRGLTQNAGLSHLVAALSLNRPGVHARAVRKSRLTVTLKDCDPMSLVDQIKGLELQNLPNRSYGEVLSAGPIALADPPSRARAAT